MARAPPVGRPRLPGGKGRREKKDVLRSYTAATKKAVVEYLRLHRKMRHTIDVFPPDLLQTKYPGTRVLVLKWARNFDKIAANCASPGGRLKKKARAAGSSTILPADMEKELLCWINDLRAEGVPVTALMLKLKALDAAEELGIQGFRASPSWQRRFKRRHRLSLRSRTRQGQVPPEELAQVAVEFSAKVHAKPAELGVSVIYNADQTAAFFEFLPSKTLNRTGEKTVWVRCGGKTKERATVMLLGDSNARKFPPFMIFKSKPSTIPERRDANTRLRHGISVTVWKEIGPAQQSNDVQIHGNTKGWWNSYLSTEFLRYNFGSREDMNAPVLLLWDDFSGHWSEEVIQCAKELKVELLKVPPGATSVCQPADATWNGPLKARLRTLWVENLREQLLTRDTTIKFKLKPPTRATICNWVSTAWRDMLPSIISGGYRKCGLDVFPEPDLATDLVRALAVLGSIDKDVGEIRPDRDFDEGEEDEDQEDEDAEEEGDEEDDEQIWSV